MPDLPHCDNRALLVQCRMLIVAALTDRPIPLALAIALTFLVAGIVKGVTVMGLGVALTVYAGISLLNRQLSVPPRTERQLSPLIGLVTGLVTGGDWRVRHSRRPLSSGARSEEG